MPPDRSTRRPADRTDCSEECLGLFFRSQSRVQAYIRSIAPDAAHADDVFQTTSLVLWRAGTR